MDETSGYTAYYNEQTGESSWNPPPDGTAFRWIQQEEAEEAGTADTVLRQLGDPEGLGVDWIKTEWVPPSLERAKAFGKRSIFRGGEARLDCPIDERRWELGSCCTSACCST